MNQKCYKIRGIQNLSQKEHTPCARPFSNSCSFFFTLSVHPPSKKPFQASPARPQHSSQPTPEAYSQSPPSVSSPVPQPPSRAQSCPRLHGRPTDSHGRQTMRDAQQPMGPSSLHRGPHGVGYCCCCCWCYQCHCRCQRCRPCSCWRWLWRWCWYRCWRLLANAVRSWFPHRCRGEKRKTHVSR